MSHDRSAHTQQSWFGSLTTIFAGTGRSPSAGKQPQFRRLRLEPLENRTLLSANVLASIAGTVFFEAKVGAITAGDIGVPNVTVKLYEDGGNGVFDGGSGAGDDTLVASTVTDSSGNYRFNNLAAGEYFVQQLPAAGYVLSPGTGVSTVIISGGDLQGTPAVVIDSFGDSSQAAASYSTGRTAWSTTSTPDAIGGQRDLLVQLTTPYGAVEMDANTYIPGMLDFSTASASDGMMEALWDGPGSNVQHLNPTGLNQVDLTAGNTASGIRLALGADHDGTTAVLRIYSDATDWSSATVTVPNTGDGTANQGIFVPFVSFTVGGGTGADFSKVGAVQLNIDGPSAVDGQVGPIETVGPKVFTCNFTNLAQTDLGIVKTDSPNPAVAGQQLTYTLQATNYGPSNATAVTVSDTLPAGVTFVSATASQGTTNFTNGVLTVDVGNLADGAGATTTVLVTIAPGTTGVLTNTATITGNEPDPNLANNTSTVTTQVNAQADLAIVKAATPNPVEAGQQLTYTLNSTNNGPSNATGVTVTDTLPAGVTFVSAASSQGNVSYANGTVTILVGNLAVGAAATSTIVVDVNSTTTGDITNTAVIGGNQPDPNLANNQSSVTTTVTPPFIPHNNSDIDLAITKIGVPNPVNVGATLTYTLTIVNYGPATATGVIVDDTLPAGLTVVSTSTSQGSDTATNGTVEANLGTLADNATATVTIVATVDPGVGPTLVNSATVSGEETDSNPNNNRATFVTDVLTLPLSKRRFLGR